MCASAVAALCVAVSLATEAYAQERHSPPTLVPQSNRDLTVVDVLEEQSYCKLHPSAADSDFRKARDSGQGIAARRTENEGAPTASYGGRECASEATRLGAAAAAVGALLYRGQLHCSGVLVSRNTVVTAAHCVKGFDKAHMEFVLGPDAHKPVERADVYNLGWHGSYDEGRSGIGDIAYVWLDRPLTKVDPVSPAPEPLTNTNLQLEYVGYGVGTPRGARRCVGIPVHDTCGDTFGYGSQQMNTCHGDSGGGVIREFGSGTWLVGITNWGDPTCIQFGVSADVGFYHDWILARISEAPPETGPPSLDQPGNLHVAVAIAVSLKRIRDESHNLQPLWAPTVFLGFRPLSRTPRLAVGLIAGVGLAENTQEGFIGGFGVQLDLWNRLGLVGGYGVRLAPEDRVRSSLGVGLTFRLWRFTPTWQ
jgi:hypothetical protein